MLVLEWVYVYGLTASGRFYDGFRPWLNRFWEQDGTGLEWLYVYGLTASGRFCDGFRPYLMV